MVKVRQLAIDDHYSLRGKTLDESIQSDKQKGLIPFFVRYFLNLIILKNSLSIENRFVVH
jgi:hypothetical protein